MNKIVVYIHGKGGNAEEAEHYRGLFPDRTVIGFDYQSQTPWEAKDEFLNFFDGIEKLNDSIEIIANSIGAYYSMCALSNSRINKAYFVSPIVDMSRLIMDMMSWEGVSESELREKKLIDTSFGETLSWEYLTWVRNNPIIWNTPTSILYGSDDNLQSMDTIISFTEIAKAELTVMKGGEHYFHTDDQMLFLDNWIRRITEND